MNKEQLVNLIGNLKLQITMLENVLADSETSPKIDECMNSIAKIVSTYEDDKRITLDYSVLSGSDLQKMKVLRTEQESQDFDQKMAKYKRKLVRG